MIALIAPDRLKHPPPPGSYCGPSKDILCIYFIYLFICHKIVKEVALPDYLKSSDLSFDVFKHH